MRCNPSWYTQAYGFFGQYYRETYRKTLTEEQTKKEVDFLEKYLKLERGCRILDLACAYGRHSIELARRGYDVTGQDINSEFLAEAQRTAQEAGVRVQWVQEDMRMITAQEPFDVVLSMFSSFGYLEDDTEDQKVLGEVARALCPGGIFFLDFHNRERMIRNRIERIWNSYEDGSIELVQREFDFLTGKDHDELTRIWADGTREVKHISFRLYTIAELVQMCAKEALLVDEVLGDFDGSALNFDSPCAIVVARKGP